MDQDEKISYFLGGLGALWLIGGLLLLARAARWARDAGIAGPRLEEGLAALYLVVLGALGFGSLFFEIRGRRRSGDLAAILVLILNLLMVFLLGRAILRLLGGG
jgi:hypothetical protein